MYRWIAATAVMAGFGALALAQSIESPVAPDPFSAIGRPVVEVTASFAADEALENDLPENPVYPLRWFDMAEAVPTEFRTRDDDERTVTGIRVYFPKEESERQHAVINRVSAALGEPEAHEQAQPGESIALWIHEGVQYALADGEDGLTMDISLAWYIHAGLEGLPANALLMHRLREGERRIALVAMPFAESSIFMERLYLALEEASGRLVSVTELPVGGYDPRMELIDLNGDGHNDVFLSIPTGGSGGISAFFAYSLQGELPEAFLNTEESEPVEFEGRFEPGYQARITIQGHDQSFTVDLGAQQGLYDELGIYRDGELLEAVDVWGGGFAAMTPESLAEGDGPYALRGIQQIRGVSNADRIATVTALLRYTDGTWIPEDVTVEAIVEPEPESERDEASEGE